MDTNPRQPRTTKEWQEAVDLAKFFLSLDGARKYGFVTGGPEIIDIERCTEILKQGRCRGVRPSPGCVERLSRVFCEGVPEK
jgi:hypothetical protein